MPREASSQFEAGVRELVARLSQFELRLKRTEDQAGEAWQRLLLFQPHFMPSATPTPNTTISGTVFGCSGIALPVSGQTVTIKDGGGATLGTTGTTSSGTYTAMIYLAANA